jgi:hypothetical protein
MNKEADNKVEGRPVYVALFQPLHWLSSSPWGGHGRSWSGEEPLASNWEEEMLFNYDIKEANLSLGRESVSEVKASSIET